MRHKKEWTPFAGKVSNRQRPVRFRSKKCDFQNETNNNLFLEQYKLHSKTGKSTYFYKQRWFTYLIPSLSTLALLLVIGFSINPISTQNNHQAFAETNASTQSNDIVPENGVALRIDTTLNDKDTIEEQVTSTGTQYIKVDFTVGANNIQNYDVYVQADSTALTGTSHGDKLQSITSDSTSTVGTKEWGYGVSRGDVDPSTMTYHPIQTSVSTSADSQDAGEGKTLTGISQPYTLAFAANLEGAASDHYKSNITLSVAAGAGEVATLYSVKYDGNGGSNIPQEQSETTLDSSYTVKVPGNVIPTRTDYSFLGWSTSSTASTASYEPGGNVTLQKSSPTTTLYAVWKPVTNQLTTLSNMQDTNLATACTNTTTPSKWDTVSGVPMAQLVDNRDNKKYWVAKLADGNCWMVQNLALDLQGKTLTTANSDVSANWSGASGVASGLWTGSSSDYNVIKWYHSDVGSGLSSYGNYYSWGAATAGTGSSTSDYGNAASSICPRGWRLPLSKSSNNSNSKSFHYLLNQYGMTSSATNSITGQKISSAPLYFVYGGYVLGSSLVSAGSQGRYWSSTAGDSSGAYFLAFDTNVGPSNVSNRYHGYSVRCVAR